MRPSLGTLLQVQLLPTLSIAMRYRALLTSGLWNRTYVSIVPGPSATHCVHKQKTIEKIRSIQHDLDEEGLGLRQSDLCDLIGWTQGAEGALCCSWALRCSCGVVLGSSAIDFELQQQLSAWCSSE